MGGEGGEGSQGEDEGRSRCVHTRHHVPARYDFHPAEQLAELTIPRLARRITAGIQARATGLTVYLEHGQSPHAKP
ncbi:hypothetical protein GCM10010346_64970 [Streptomyces chryseus]|uniref:Uncharacterized protein n=1 Tax=Streptomyces chryseus TaxID=68186 RepID=A0ABQ3EBV9_9ACTN|nr:hypothetical protein GCM10010346_64970 [Streptomyces chryseus]